MTVFIHEQTTEKDISDLFDENDNFVPIDLSWTLEDIVIHLGKFTSKTQARKNNWSGKIPFGFKEWKIGKTFFWTFIPLELDESSEYHQST